MTRPGPPFPRSESPHKRCAQARSERQGPPFPKQGRALQPALEEKPRQNVLRVCRGLRTKWTADAPEETAGRWAVTGSAARWLAAAVLKTDAKEPGDVDILVDSYGMLNAFYILGHYLGMTCKQKDPSFKANVRTFTHESGLKVDLINVSRFGVAVDFDTDIKYALGIPVLSEEKLVEFEKKRYG